jgi:polyisoprenoid-binding protein YceI
MKYSLISGAILFGCALSAFAEPVNFTIDSTHTFPSFEISHVGFSTQRGRFNSTQGTISVDMQNHTGTIDITIDANTIDTGLDKLEEKLRGEKFFNVAKFPTITFKSSSLVFNGDDLVAVDGELTMLGVTKAVHLAITSFKCGIHPASFRKVCGVDAETTIKRSEFGMTYGIPAVGDDVKLLLQVEAFQAPEAGLRKH